MAVVLLLVIYEGVSAGRTSSAGASIVSSAQNLQKGLGYFYQDQNRFPTAVEFSDQVVMANYYNNFPPSDFKSSSCSQSYVYKRISDVSYQLNFCLPVATNGFSQGWNVLHN